jgi:hypothetical protein
MAVAVSRGEVIYGKTVCCCFFADLPDRFACHIEDVVFGK